MLKWIDQKGGVWLGLWSALMMGLVVYSVVVGKNIPDGVAAVYTAVLAAFAANSVTKQLKGTRRRRDLD